MTRTDKLQTFINSLEEAFLKAPPDADIKRIVQSIFGALARPAPAGKPTPAQLPVCQQMPQALALARSSNAAMAELANAFSAISTDLAWTTRATNGPHSSDNWRDGHANATIIGPHGIETRNDVWIGVSLMAPHVRYPDHTHEPEEIYLLMTPGKFKHGQSNWSELGIGGTFHNVPNIRHAMASDERPFLAFWCLLTRK